MTAAIQVTGLTKSYGPRPALRGLDLTLGWGESLTLFGPNGSGKSTLIKVLATLASPTAGQIRVAGLDPRHEAGRLRRLIGVVTHEPLLYEELTGEENLRFHGRMFRVQGLEARIADLAQELALERLLPLRVRTLSHGMRRRISLARALLHEPPLLLLDEPETGLDQEALGLLDGLLTRHRAAGGSLLMTTHNIEGGVSIGDRVAILRAGRIAYQGAADGLGQGGLRDLYAQVTGAEA